MSDATEMAKQTSRSNLIWLFGDQHRFHANGFAGDANVHPPNIDDLALTGFTPARGGVAGYPLCCPFRCMRPRCPTAGKPWRTRSRMPVITRLGLANGTWMASASRGDAAPITSCRPRVAEGSTNGSVMRTTTASSIAGCMVAKGKTTHHGALMASKRKSGHL